MCVKYKLIVEFRVLKIGVTSLKCVKTGSEF